MHVSVIANGLGKRQHVFENGGLRREEPFVDAELNVARNEH